MRECNGIMKSYIIYGAAAIGDLVKVSLEKCRFHVTGYIDRRAFELKSYNGLPVWSLENVPEQYVTEDTVVFVGVKNVFEHERIVRLLIKRGFQYIIYKPYGVIMGHGTTEEERISAIYDRLFQGMPEAGGMEAPKCTVNAGTSMHDYALLKDLGEELIAYIPAEFICTNNYLQGGMVKWGSVNILAFFTHIDFFRFLDNREDASPQAYLEEYCEFTARLQKKITITDAWRDNVIRNRSQIYEKMSESMNLDADFFVRNAPEAVWNDERHIFNLTSGKHRSTFLAARGLKYVPLKMKKEDYYKFFHDEAAVKVKELLSAAEEDIIIPHPCFYRDVRSVDKGEYTLLSWFARFYGRKSFYKYGKVTFRQMKIMDRSNDSGNFARFLLRLECEVHRFFHPTELEKQLNALFYSAPSYKSENDSLETDYDIGIIDGSEVENILFLMGHCKNFIIKYCPFDSIKHICNGMDLRIVLKINERYEGLEMKGTYLLTHKEE